MIQRDDRWVAIIDYGMGNLYNVQRACDSVGLPARITDDPAEMSAATGAILPGVGAFRDAMAALDRSGMTEAIRGYVAANRPFLGICLGFQLLMSESYEFGAHKGLGIVEGTVERLRGSQSVGGVGVKVPHVGWNRIHPGPSGSWAGTVLETVPAGAFMYFTHSYCVKPTLDDDALAVTSYGDEEFCSGLRVDSVSGVQFHPELSGPTGLGVYRSFARRTKRKEVTAS